MDNEPFKDALRRRQMMSGNINPFAKDYSWNRDVTKDNIKEIVAFFKKALREDPFFKGFFLVTTDIDLSEEDGGEIVLGPGMVSIGLVLLGNEDEALRAFFRYHIDASGNTDTGRITLEEMENDFANWKSTFPQE